MKAANPSRPATRSPRRYGCNCPTTGASPRPDLGCQMENVFIETPEGYVEINDSILVYDNIHGGMGLVSELYRSIERYARNLNVGLEGEPGTGLSQVRELNWSGGCRRAKEITGPCHPEYGPDNWWRVARTGSRVRAFSELRKETAEGRIEGHEWRDEVLYLVDLGNGTAWLRDRQIASAGSALDWELWQPATGRRQELQFLR